jgi:hypothetical protein
MDALRGALDTVASRAARLEDQEAETAGGARLPAPAADPS